MRPSVQCVGSVRVPLPHVQALELFTPEGERSWVDGWAPRYSAAGGPDPERGLVFTVGKESGRSVWIVTRFEPDLGGASYAYVLPGRRAVLVDVDVAASPDGTGSTATVAYRMTSLAPEGDAFVRGFEGAYGAFLRGWEEDIRRSVEEGGAG